MQKANNIIVNTFSSRLYQGWVSRKGSKCCDLVNAPQALSVNHRYDAFTRSQHLRPFEIPTPESYYHNYEKPCQAYSGKDSTLAPRGVLPQRIAINDYCSN